MSIPTTKDELTTLGGSVRAAVEVHLEESGGLLCLSPTRVQRSSFSPGLRIKLHSDDTYAHGLNRGGIGERWFGSTTETANEGREVSWSLLVKDMPEDKYQDIDFIIDQLDWEKITDPELLRFNELSQDEFLRTEGAATNGATFKNTSKTEPPVAQRDFGPEKNPDALAMGAYKIA